MVLIERTTLVYLRAFNQLVWLVHSNLVGDLVSVKCAISQDDFEGGRTFNETVCTAICAVLKLLGKKMPGYQHQCGPQSGRPFCI